VETITKQNKCVCKNGFVGRKCEIGEDFKNFFFIVEIIVMKRI